MKKLLLDTSVLVDFLRRKKKEETLLAKVFRAGYIPAISLITHTELYAGKSVWSKAKAKRELENLLAGLDIIILNEEVSRLAGKIRAKYRLGIIDAIIAAEAIISQLPLVTLNLKDFEKVKGVKILLNLVKGND